MGTKSSVRANLVSLFRVATGASVADAYCYLEAEEWDLDDALISWRTDSYSRDVG